MKLLPIDVTVPQNSELTPCDVCPRAKQQRLHFHLSTISTCVPFELVHINTWGPYHTKSYSGHRYFLTIVDDYTRTTWTHLIVTKDEAIGFIKAFVTMIHTQFSYKVKTIRSDNALEFTKSDTALEFFASNSILHQTSCIQTPQQNGVVERKHKHLLEVSRALLFQSKLPLRLWGDCVLTATHLINRLPTLLLYNKTPFEVLYGKAPSYEHLRVFGCLCYMSTTKQGHDKFQPRALPCIFMISLWQKAYKVMDLEKYKIHTSRDVVFHETVFPFAESSTTPPLFPHTTPAVSQEEPGFSQPTEPTTTESPCIESPDTPQQSAPPSHNVTRSTRVHKPPFYLADYVLFAHRPSFCFTTLTNLSLQPPLFPVTCLHTTSQEFLGNLNYTEL